MQAQRMLQPGSKLCAPRQALLPLARPHIRARRSARPSQAPAPCAVLTEAPPAPKVAPPPTPETTHKSPSQGSGGQDPWNDLQWTKYKWTVYRGVAYDLTAFIERHPGGAPLATLAVGRDSTALFESYHLRPEVATAHLRRLPVLEGFPVDAVPRSPYPNDSEVYCAIRDRVREEVFGGKEAQGAHRTGSDWAALTILSYAALSYSLFLYEPNVATAILYGLASAWVGLTIQHCGNHGAMSTSPLINHLLGLTLDLTGGSSLIWRYHHQVSHHIHCNDDGLDEDVFSAYPLLRFDARLPKRWFHRYQHLYMWAAFPLMTLGGQYADTKALLTNRSHGATMYGIKDSEKATFLAGKAAYFTLLLGLPWALHGPSAALLGALATYAVTHSVTLATTFAVSHNVPESKPLDGGVPRDVLYMTEWAERDWGVQQIVTSADWGGVVGNFFTGGLNLQVEHHLFPAISFMHYPAIQKIVAEECAKRGIPYAYYGTLPEILVRYVQYMKDVGTAEQAPSTGLAAAQLSRV